MFLLSSILYSQTQIGQVGFVYSSVVYVYINIDFIIHIPTHLNCSIFLKLMSDTITLDLKK